MKPTESIKNTVSSLLERHAIETMVSSNQKGLKDSQLRVYRDYGDCEREYFVITISKERINK